MALSAEAAKLLGQIKGDASAVLQAWRTNGGQQQLLRELYAADGDDFDVQYFLAGYAETPSRILEDLSTRSEAPTILTLLAENPRTPKTVLQQLARHERVDVRLAVAAGRGISPQTAVILSDDEDARVRAVLAENPSLTPRMQVKLSEDPVPFVRANLLKLSKLDEEVQMALCDDRDVTVQAKALLAPKLSTDVLLRSADSDDERLAQKLLLLRSQIPDKVLESLLLSTNSEIQQAAAGRKRLSEDEMLMLSREGDEGMRKRIAALPGVPADVQVMLAGDDSPEVRLLVAGNACICAEAVRALLDRNEEAVDWELAENDRVDLEELAAAAAERRGAALWHHVACREVLTDREKAFLAEHGDDGALYQLWYRGTVLKQASPEVLWRLIRHTLPSVRELAARSSGLTIAMMAELSRDDSPLVRLALVSNAEVLPSYLETLSNDGEKRVAARAHAMLEKLRCEELREQQKEAQARAAAEALAAAGEPENGETPPPPPSPWGEEEGAPAAEESSGGGENSGNAEDGEKKGRKGLLRRFKAIFHKDSQ